MNTSGQSALGVDARFGALRVGVQAAGLLGSERFAGCGGFNGKPPDLNSYDARHPRARRVVMFLPGHLVVPEF